MNKGLGKVFSKMAASVKDDASLKKLFDAACDAADELSAADCVDIFNELIK